MMKKIGSALLACVLLAVIYFVKDQNFQAAVYDVAGFGGSTASSPAKPSGQDGLQSAKMEPFVKCYNRVHRAFRENYDAYAQLYAARDAGNVKDAHQVSTGQYFSSFKVAVYEQNNDMSKECATGLEAASVAQPADADLDRVGKSYAATLRALLPVVNDIEHYYAQNTYRDDAMKLGRELDAKFRPLITKLMADGNEIDRLLSDRTESLRDRELVAHEKVNGRDADWHLLNTLIVARRGIEAIEKSATGKQPTADEIKVVEGKVEAAFNGGVAYVKANPPADAGPKPVWFSVEKDVSNVLTAIKDVRRSLEADPVSPGAIDKINYVVTQYNSMVRSYNMQANIRG